MKIAICDDSRAFRAELGKHLKKYYEERLKNVKIYHFSSGKALLTGGVAFDLVFLDAKIGGKDGIETCREINRKIGRSITILVTSHEEFLDDAFRINAFRFLPKPLDVIRLYRALDDAEEFLNNETIVFHDAYNCKDYRIYTKEIIYIEIVNRRTKVVTVNDTFYSNSNITEWRDKLKGISFVSPHSSFIVNLNYSIFHSRSRLVLGKKDEVGRILETFEISIASRKQTDIRRMFFYLSKKE